MSSKSNNHFITSKTKFTQMTQTGNTNLQNNTDVVNWCKKKKQKGERKCKDYGHTTHTYNKSRSLYWDIEVFSNKVTDGTLSNKHMIFALSADSGSACASVQTDAESSISQVIRYFYTCDTYEHATFQKAVITVNVKQNINTLFVFIYVFFFLLYFRINIEHDIQ